jgi:hypothetical protein
MFKPVGSRARWGLLATLFGLAACGIAERRVEELTEAGGAGGAAFHAGSAQGGFVTGGVSLGGAVGVPSGGVPIASGGNVFGGMPFGGMVPVVECSGVPPFEASCEPSAGGAPADEAPSCGAISAEGDASGSGGAAGAADAGAPSVPGPPLRVLVDDFEDGDEVSLPVLGGQGVWYVVNDGSGLQFPSPCTLPSLLSEPERGSERAMRTYGQGFLSQPGGYSLIGLSVRSGAPACDQAIDASNYQGVEFWARGSGTVRFFIGTVATNPVVDAGTCPGNCYDAHGSAVILSDDWQVFRVSFAELTQEGWGYPAAFDPSKILGLQWSAKLAPFDFTPAACFDFWIDDVAFYSR